MRPFELFFSDRTWIIEPGASFIGVKGTTTVNKGKQRLVLVDALSFVVSVEGVDMTSQGKIEDAVKAEILDRWPSGIHFEASVKRATTECAQIALF